jgi:small GTP-binding protein
VSLLNNHAQQILDAERDLLRRLLQVLRATDASDDTVEALEDMIEHLEGLFLVVLVGEFNAGKSTVVNALLGDRVMEEGPIPTTAKITLLRHGETPLTQQRTEYLTERRVPSDLLRHLTLVDTPGTNSIVQEHQRITEDFIPRSDLVLFITSYDRPLTESERKFLTYIREDWGRRIVFVVNKADLAGSEGDLQQVLTYVRSNGAEILGTEPTVLPVDAKTALRARLAGEPVDAASGFAELEMLFTDTLTGTAQVALKLTAPLETADRLLERLGERLGERRSVLRRDRETLSRLQAQIDAARTDLADGTRPHLDAIADVFADVRERGVRFLNDTIRVSRIGLLRDREAFRQQFEREVVSETTRQIEGVVTEAVDDILSRTVRLQQDLFQTFASRVEDARRNRQFSTDQSFAYDRKEVFASIMDAADRQIRTHDLQREVRRIVENVYNDANIVVGAGAGAAVAGGLGIVLVIASALDAVGGLGLATGAAAALYGATVLPRQRRKAIDDFTGRIDTLKAQIQDALRERLHTEVDAALDRVWETVEPFADFVAEETDVLDAAVSKRTALRNDCDDLHKTVRRDIGTPSV